MLGMNDCKDSLRTLFERKDAIRTESLSLMRSKVIAIDVTVLLAHFFRTRKYLAYSELIADFKRNLDLYDIKLLVVFGGKDNFDDQGVITSYKYLSKFFTKLYFFKMIVIEFIQDKDTKHSEAQLLRNVLKYFFRDSLNIQSVEDLFFNRLISIFIKNGIEFIRAPQMRENQLLWLYENGKVDAVAGNPLICMQGSITQVIASFEFEKGQFSYYDLESLASNVDCEVEALRTYIYGIALYFNSSPEMRSSSKAIKASQKNISDFVKTYKRMCQDNAELVEKLIKNFKEKLDLSDANKAFNSSIATLLGLNKSDVIDLNRLFSRSCVLSDAVDIPFYPLKKGLSNHRLIIDTHHKDLVILFSMGILDKELFLLMNKTTHHSILVNIYTNEFLDMKIARTHFYIPKLKTALSRLMRATGQTAIGEFKIAFGKSSPVSFTAKPLQYPPTILATSPAGDVNVYTCIAELHKNILVNSKLISIDKSSILSTKQILCFMYLDLLDNLKYINKQNRNILTLGAALAEIGEFDFLEEIIVIFELFKLGAIKSKFFHQESEDQSTSDLAIFNGNYLDDLIESTFNIAEKPLTSGDILNISDVSQPETPTKIVKPQMNFAQIFSKDLATRNHKSSIRTSIVEKTINMFYKTIKRFQIQYRSYYGVKFSQRKLDLILNDAFQNNRLGKILMISRFFVFVKTGIYIEDYYEYDSCQYDLLVKTVIDGIRHLLVSSLMLVFFESDLNNDLSLTYEVFKKLPFNVNYQQDSGSFIKIKLTEFILWKSLEKNRDEFARVFLQNLSMEATRKQYNTSTNLVKYYKEGSMIFQKSLDMLQTCKKYDVQFLPQNLMQDMLECRVILREFLAFHKL